MYCIFEMKDEKFAINFHKLIFRRYSFQHLNDFLERFQYNVGQVNPVVIKRYACTNLIEFVFGVYRHGHKWLNRDSSAMSN